MLAEKEQKAWNVYVARQVQLISENIAKRLGGSYMNLSYQDMITKKPSSNPPSTAKEKSAEEILSKVISRGGLKVV